jgi:hypothetical protein
MLLPTPQPVSLSGEQVAELNRKLTDMRHDINNYLSLIVAASELIRHKPETAGRMVATMSEQPSRISDALRKFSAEFEKILGIPRP